MSAIDDKYAALGGPGGFLGPPADEGPRSQEMETRNSVGRTRDFRNGSIYWKPGVGAFSIHGRAELGTFEDDLNDDDFKLAALTFNDSIRRHINFLDGVVHQAAPGEVLLRLWNLILDSRSDDTSIYALYCSF